MTMAMAMAIVLALGAALAYGISDFAAGVASRRFSAGPVTGVAQTLGLLTAAVAVITFPGAGPKAAALEWGALSGLGSATGTLSLYQGLSVARMSVVATLAGVLTAVIPVIVGIALGNHLSVGAAAGILLAIPAIALVSWQPEPDDRSAARAGVLYGMLAGLGFALLFIALDRAGTDSGAWPLLPGQTVSLLPIAPFAYRGLKASGRPSRAVAGMALGAGVLSGSANLLFLAATGHGELAIVAVLSALYPAITVVMARVFLAEHWTPLQTTGLAIAAVAIVLVTIG
jgi:drug/metabolite transporter (DMT)-like permease